MKQKRFMRFERDKDEFEPVYIVYNRSYMTLGKVYYNSSWRKFVFESDCDTYFDAKCLDQMVQFLAACDKKGYKNMWRETNET